MGRYCLGAWAVVASCLLVAFCAARSLSREGTERRWNSGMPPLVGSEGFIYHDLFWPRLPLPGGTPILEQGGTEANAYHLVHGLLFLSQEPWTVIVQPRERLPPSPDAGSRRSAEKRKRALSVLATLHPARPSAQDTGRRQAVPEAAAVPTHRPIGKQPLRWGR